MSQTTPLLDTRKFQDIMVDAKSRITQSCPQWNDFDSQDPGITLVNLMAKTMEMLIHQLNRVPDKNYIEFMELTGIALKPPQPATTWLVFYPAEGANTDTLPVIPIYTRVSGTDANNNIISFETTESLNLNTSKLLYIFTQANHRYTDGTAYLLPPPDTTPIPLPLFTGTTELPTFLYLGDPEIGQVNTDFVLKISIKLETELGGEPFTLQWSCWDGKQWCLVWPDSDQTHGLTKSGDICFSNFPKLAPCTVNQETNYWLRGQLLQYQNRELPIILEIKKTLELKKKMGLVPQFGFFCSAEIPYMPILFVGLIQPFGSEGKENDTMYIGSDILGRKGASVTIDTRPADSFHPTLNDELKKLKIYWEYYSQSGEWNLLGISSPDGTLSSRCGFIDFTEAFTEKGLISFYVPTDIAPLDISGQFTYWLRFAIRESNYGIKKKKNPPVLKQFLLRYTEKPDFFANYLAYVDFQFFSLDSYIRDHKNFKPFDATEEPEFYLCFDKKLSNRQHTLYFQFQTGGSENGLLLWEYYSTQKNWQSFHPKFDGTDDFTQSGIVKFVAPDDWLASQKFGQSGYWLRVCWESKDSKTPQKLPVLTAIYLNTVYATQEVSYFNEVLGSSNNLPSQQFYFHQAPILPDPCIMVREFSPANVKEAMDFKENVSERIVEVSDPQTGEITELWVIWERQDSFYASTPMSRHYLLDITKGIITFGDGIMGKIPPQDDGNIKCLVYKTGGGMDGNIKPNTLITLEAAIPFIDHVTNPFPAAGGTDPETLEEAKIRAPRTFKHRYRAVTAEDFETLALEAGSEVQHASCRGFADGVIKMLIIPAEKEADHGKLLPSAPLCRLVEDYLQQHALLTLKIAVTGPSYHDIPVKIELTTKEGLVDPDNKVYDQVNASLSGFVHPLTGGPDGKGYPIGRTLHLSELYYLIKKVPGIDHIESVTLDNKPGEKNFRLEEEEFPYLFPIQIIAI